MMVISLTVIALAGLLPRLFGRRESGLYLITAGEDRISMAEAIRIENVTKRFAEHAAVDDVNLAIARGEFFSPLGPSGCGKTTPCE